MAANQDERAWLEQRRLRDGVLQVWHQRPQSKSVSTEDMVQFLQKVTHIKDATRMRKDKDSKDKKDGVSKVSEDAEEDYIFQV